MKEKSVAVGIVGSGFAASFHCESYRKMPGVHAEVKAVYSKTETNRRRFAATHGVKACDSLQELIESVDVVDLCVPGFLHEPFAVQTLGSNKHVIVEKPFTGYYGPEEEETFLGNKFSKVEMQRQAVASATRICKAEAASKGKIFYAENWIYAPAIQKEIEILKSANGQILWILGEESHSGSHSKSYGIWRQSGGGSVVGKSCHPLGAALYLKRIEGYMRGGNPIRPASVSCRTHEITRNTRFTDAGFLRVDYHDVEDYGQMHIVFEDGMVADIFASEIVMGGVKNWLEVIANNHRTFCNLSFTDAVRLFNPREEQLQGTYIVEKIETKQGWSFPSPDEDWMFGYPQELTDFIRCVRTGEPPQSGSEIAWDITATLYSAYVSAERKGLETEIPVQKGLEVEAGEQ